jgi:tetratricopeptide (TPR) repeat protein
MVPRAPTRLLLIAVMVAVAGSTQLHAQGPTATARDNSHVQANGSSGTTPASESVSAARHLLDQGKVDDVIAALEDLASKASGTPGLEAALGKAYYQKRDFEKAANHLEIALKQDSNDAESTQLLGLSYHLLNHVQQAIPLLEKVQSLLPRPDVTGSYLLGIDYLRSYQDGKARVAFARMFSVPPDSAQAYVVLAQMMIREQFEDKAIPELQKGLEIDPHVPMAHFLLGEMYLFKSQVEPAIAEFKKELAENPVLWLAYWRMGDAYTRLEQWDAAEGALKQAVWLNPDFTGPYILLGKVELKKGDAALAAGFLERALKMDPNNANSHYILGQAYQKLGRNAEADREFALTQSLRDKDK